MTGIDAAYGREDQSQRLVKIEATAQELVNAYARGDRGDLIGLIERLRTLVPEEDVDAALDEREARMKGGGRVLDFDQIPIERHWGLSMRLHDALGHTEPWEICEAGCDALASEAILILFDVTGGANVDKRDGPEGEELEEPEAVLKRIRCKEQGQR